MAKRVTLPKQIFVVREQEAGSESYLLATETMESIDDGTVVGVYELKETRKMRVTRELK